ncbi:receptor-interacting serine/threonine-protein kinase 2 isoform X3 [Conger conger]|nr:receptor-interacting serine/threonine-protein kinase 2 isoform X3 [Conger conger]
MTRMSCCQMNGTMAQPGPLVNIAEQDVLNVVLTQTSTGACLRGVYGKTGGPVCLKFFPSERRQRWSRQYMQDLTLVRQTCSNRVLVPLGWYSVGWLVGLVSDWMPGGSLHSLLYETQLYPEFPLPLRLRILLDVAEGLSHLHALPVPHRTLKPSNVLLDQQGRAKVCDFSQRTGPALSQGPLPCLTDLAYLSPEALHGDDSSTEADVYSFGLLLSETLNRRAPYEKIASVRELLVFVQKGVWPGAQDNALPPETPHRHALSRLIALCWSGDPQIRPTAPDCMLELKEALATFHMDSPNQAAVQLTKRKERALLGCKAQQAGQIKMELNNMELCQDTKSAGTKTLPVSIAPATLPIPPALSPENTPTSHLPAPSQGRSSTEPEAWCCQDAPVPRPRSASGRQGQRHSPSPPAPLCSSASPGGLSPPAPLCSSASPGGLSPPAPLCSSASPGGLSPPAPLCSSASPGGLNPSKHTPLGPPAPSAQGIPGQSCCQILRERREAIVRCMTNGRLNHLLDVLRSRQALNREEYELITVALTLPARTRALLDTCLCLGERPAALVVSTLGLVPTATTPHPCHCSN